MKIVFWSVYYNQAMLTPITFKISFSIFCNSLMQVYYYLHLTNDKTGARRVDIPVIIQPTLPHADRLLKCLPPVIFIHDYPLLRLLQQYHTLWWHLVT